MPNAPPRLGPVFICSLVARDGQRVADAYCRHMHQQLVGTNTVNTATAAALGVPALTGQRSWQLANMLGRQWLQVIEYQDAQPRDSLGCFGWMAMEVVVAAVDTLAESLAASPFELLRPPANLDISDNIRACQVRGPAGEVLYLTEINGAAPPFELPRAQAPVDHLFIPVLSSPSRDASLAEYSALAGNTGLCFETRVSVVNQARDLNLEQRHPVASLQLAGQSLLEIDQIADTTEAGAGIHCGVMNIAFTKQGSAANAAQHTTGVFAGRATTAHTGIAGEHYTLVYN